MSLGLDDLADLRSEFLDRGFSYLSTARANRYVSLGYFELCDSYEWPFLEASQSGTMPMTITDLATVESVVNTTSELKILPMDRRLTQDGDPKLDDAGTADTYYISSGTTVNVYPLNTTNQFTVRYWKVPTDLTSDASVPIIPERWRYLIVESACRRAYQDSDNPELAQMCAQELMTGLNKMVEVYSVQQHDRPDEIQTIESWGYEWGRA